MLTRLIGRIIFLDGFPNMQRLESLHIGKTVKAVLDSDLKAELSAHSLYAEAATHCHSVKDYRTRSLFETLMHDEGRAHRLSGNPDRSRPKIGPELYPNIIGELGEDWGVEVDTCEQPSQTQPIIDGHSAFSRARNERFREGDVFRRVFERVVETCIAAGLVGGEGFAVDASLIQADANKQRSIAGQDARLPRADQRP
jgi:hypothetical protein